MKEIWTLEAKNTFLENIKYLKSKWTKKEVNTFVEKSFEVIDMIKKNPDIGQFDTIWKAHRFLITKQITLFYSIDKENLVLISFWNNYKKPLK